MDSDEEDNSRPPLNNSAIPSLIPATSAEELPLADSQCGPHPDADISFPLLSAANAQSRFLTPEATPMDTRDSGDLVAPDSSCFVNVAELPVEGSTEVSQSPRSLLPMAEGDQDDSSQAEGEGGDVEPLEIMPEVPMKNEKDGIILLREGGHDARENSDLTPNKDNNREPELDNVVEDKDGVMNVEGNDVLVNGEIETEVVADEGAGNSVMDEPAMAYEDNESIDKVGVEEELKEEPTDVEEGLGELKEENETDAAEEAFNETRLMDEMKATDSMEEVETDVAGTADEMEVTEEAEEIEEGDNAEETEEGDNPEEIEEGSNAEEIEGDIAEDIGDNEEDIGEGDNAKEIEGDNVEDIQITDRTKAAAADEVEEVSINVGGKRKRGKNAKTPVRNPSRKNLDEDVCFICFDGGELVLCDRRGCPKAYHPTCVNRDDAFFRSRGRWNCGWHICSNCEKNSYYMCYTCTFSLCKGCIKDAVILCVRGNKGFCEACMKTVMLIERGEQENKETALVDFDDRSSFEYLFKDYWVELKEKLSLTFDEISQAKNPWKGSEVSAGKRESRDELHDAQNDGGSGSDDSSGNPEVNPSKRKKVKKRLESNSKGRDSMITSNINRTQVAFTDENAEWASKELLEFVMHMKNGDKSVCSQFDVQALLLEYIKRKKLRDPRRKSQIICDSRLEKLFGKSRVGHFEMLKLLESHFLLKEDSQVDDLQGSVVDTDAFHSEIDGSDGLMKGCKDRRRRSRNNNHGRGLQSNLDDYAAIDTNNINLIYLRRSLVENLLDDTETFHDKVVGAFVRIRISASGQKQDLYRLVQVAGTNKATEPYKVGKRTTEFLLEILNLNKTEIVSIDIISNQDFTEDECMRLRQSIKCGLINRLTVGDIQEKAMALQAVRVEDSLETEITRLSHLRDRASDMGRRKELRECVEKLQLLKSPAERQRRLEEIPEVRADPNMDPNYESEEDEDEIEDKKQGNYMRYGGSSFNMRGRDPISPGRGSLSSVDSWSTTRSYPGTNRELNRSLSTKGFSLQGDDVRGGGEMLNEHLRNQGGDKETPQSQSWERPKPALNLDYRSVHASLPSESIPSVKQEIAVGPSSKAVVASTTNINETQKIWHYKDPSGKIQGPFSMVQLRKWSITGYFPADLRIWRATDKQDDSILLTDALAGNFQREPQVVDSSLPNTQSLPGHFEVANSAGQATPNPREISKYSTDKWDSETNLPSPTPAQAARSGTKGPRESRWSPTLVQSVGANPLEVGNGELRHAALVMPQSGQLSHSSISSPSVKNLSSVNSPHMLSQLTMPSESPRGQTTSHLLPMPDSTGASVNVAQNLVCPMTVTNPLIGTQGRGTVLASNPEMGVTHAIHGSGSQAWGGVPSQKIEQNNTISGSSQPNAYGGWGDVPSSIHNSALSFVTGNPTSVSSAPPDLWRGAATGQPNVQPSASSNLSLGANVTDSQTTSPRQGPENQNSGWGSTPGNTNMVWGGSLPTNNQGWVASTHHGPGAAFGDANPGWIAHGQGHAPGNANTDWVGSAQGHAPGNANTVWAGSAQGQAPGNVFQGWIPPAQGPAPVNTNKGWVAPGQGPPQGNGNSSGSATKGNMGSWGNEKSGDRFSSRRDGGSQGGDSGYGGGKPWNRQESHSRGDSSRPPYKGQRVCKYHESGHCKKGGACDYLHT